MREIGKSGSDKHFSDVYNATKHLVVTRGIKLSACGAWGGTAFGRERRFVKVDQEAGRMRQSGT